MHKQRQFFTIYFMLLLQLMIGCMSEAGNSTETISEDLVKVSTVTSGDTVEEYEVRGLVFYNHKRIPGAEVFILMEGEPNQEGDWPGVILTTDEDGSFKTTVKSTDTVSLITVAFVENEIALSARVEFPDTSGCILLELEMTDLQDPEEIIRAFEFQSKGASSFVGYKGYGCSCHKYGKFFGKVCCGWYDAPYPENWVFCPTPPIPLLCIWK